MPDAFIVTISDKTETFNVDLEIPAHLPVTAFKGKLLEILKNLNPHLFGSWQAYELLFENCPLAGGNTLASVGAFDGSRLTVKRRWP